MSDEIDRNPAPMSDEEFILSLHDHAVETAKQSFSMLGGPLKRENLDTFLKDRECVRIPTELRFDEEGLSSHQFAEPEFVMLDGQRKCVLHVHPRYEELLETHVPIVAYMAAVINYGASASSDLCEQYGAILTGMTVDDFYDTICHVADL